MSPVSPRHWVVLCIAFCGVSGWSANARAQELALRPQAASPSAADSDFHQGLYELDLTGGYIEGYRNPKDRLGVATVGVGYYFADNLAIGVAVSGYYVDQPLGPDTGGAGAYLVGCWHLLNLDRFSLYVDGGAGGFFADAEVPAGGTHFDFTLKAGVGASLRLNDDIYVIGGARYWHLSNANIQGTERNPGIDGIQYYVGMMFRL